jgi:hypothetical protein
MLEMKNLENQIKISIESYIHRLLCVADRISGLGNL